MRPEGNFIKQKAIRFTLIVVMILASSGITSKVSAGAINTASDTLSTIKQSVGANHTIQFTMNASDAVAATETITVTFPSGFDLTSLSSPNDFDLRINATDETLQSGACGSTDTFRAVVASQTVTFTACNSYDNTAEGSGPVVIIKIGTHTTIGTPGSNQITNQTAAQNNSDAKIVIGGTDASGTIAVEIVTDNTLAVTGTVDPQITCVISSTDGDSDANPNTTSFGTFTLGAVTTANDIPTWTISTNATNGYNISVLSTGNTTNAGLYSSAAGYVIKSADSAENSTADLSVSATIGYGLQGTKTNGDAGSATTTITAPYTSTSNSVGRLQLTAQQLASATGPVSNATVVSTLKAKVTAFVPAGTYVDTLKYVCTGIY